MKGFAVTGCDSGFGRILCELLVKNDHVVFAGCFMQESLGKISNELGNKCVPILLDVTNQASVKAFGDSIRDYLSKNPTLKLDGIVNNAGILIAPCPVEWQSLEEFERMYKVNVLGTVAVTKELLPLVRNSMGRIVNVASIAGRIGLPTQAAYCTSKFGVEAFSDVLRRDMLQWGVTVHIVEPGVFSKTGLYGDFEAGLDRVFHKQISENVRNDYGEEYYRNVRQTLSTVLNRAGNTNSHLVPEAMMHALLDEKPKYRYRVGADSKYFVTILTYLHESTQDWLLTLSGPELPKLVPLGAPKNARELSSARYDQGSWIPYLGVLGGIIYIMKTNQFSSKL